LLLVTVWWVITSAMNPLNRVGRDLANRNADSLAPVDAAGVPREVSRLVNEVNSLLKRMEYALQSQKQFVDDAAHELRSPLTALKLQVQTLARARDDAARAQAISRLQGGVERAVRLLEQLLALARQDPLSEPMPPTVVKLAECLEHAAEDVAALAVLRDIHLEFQLHADAKICADPDSLRMLIRNLLDNAIRYTPEHGKVLAKITIEGDHAVLIIEDSGTGIPPENRHRVFDRFYRMPGTTVSGSGLGLAIVKAIAERYQANVELGQASLGGLRVRIAFPRLHTATPAPKLVTSS
jgi:two-component system OmpR family sensor kinase